MRIRTKLTLNMLIISLLPLLVSMGFALWHSTNQAKQLTIHATQGRLDTAAQKLSGFFSSRIAEISAYSQVSVLKTMDFTQIRPFLMSELERHDEIYEKFILGTPYGHFYNTSGGNPYVGGLRTKNDKDPDAKPKHIRKRDYWQQTISENRTAKQTSYVSDPMISYTTGAKQVVVASSILSDNKVKGMIGGALPWKDIQKRIQNINNELIDHIGDDIKFFLISNTGTYWYHWDKTKIVQLLFSPDGAPLLNEIGEKKIIKVSILDSQIPHVAETGKKMINGERGYTKYSDPDTNRTQYIVYSHIPSANYSIGLVIPEDQILEPVGKLQLSFAVIFLIVALSILAIAYYISRKVATPIVNLNETAKKISSGERDVKLPFDPKNDDEINELNNSFNHMTASLKERENSLHQSEARLSTINHDLEKRISYRTQQLESSNERLKQQIEERVAAEEALKNSQQLLQAAGSLAHIGGWKLNLNSGELEWTHETYNIHGLANKTGITLEKATNYFTGESRKKFISAINQAKENGISFNLDLNIHDESNREVWVKIICDAVKSNNDVYELVGAYLDITKLKHIEKMKNEFVSTVSHELRTPLTAIHGSLRLINSGKLDGSSSEEKENMLHIAERNSERLLLLINDILDTEKIEAGKMEFFMRDYELSVLINQSKSENDALCDKFNVSLKLISDIPNAMVNVDKERFFQVMSNLISNAAKFSEEGSSIDISTSIADNRVTITVQDYGAGIPEEFKDKIFTKFSQADSSETRKQGGTGLGLSISQSIITHMGGEIEYQSSPDMGSRFYFTLPIVT